MNSFLQDVRYAFRTLRRSPGFAAAVVVTLTLGIGANAAIFTVLHGVVLQPLPYPAVDRLVHVWTQFPRQDIDKFVVSPVEFSDYREESELFEAMFAFQPSSAVITGDGAPTRVPMVIATADIWNVLGGRAALGATFGIEEDRPGNDDVAVLSSAFWQQRFGGDPGVIGRTLRLDGNPFRIMGVLEEGFSLPTVDADVYLPMGIDRAALTGRSGHWLSVIGRTRPGVTRDDVHAEMAVVSDRWAEQYEHAHPFTATSLHEEVVGDARTPLLVLSAAVGFVLLIACANVAGLLMARTTRRRHEIGVRAALGAARGRLVRQILVEGVLLATAAGALGLVVARFATGALLALEPGNLPRVGAIDNDLAVAAFVAGISLLAGLTLAAFPAWRVTRGGAGGALAVAGRSAGLGRQRFQRAMVMVEVAVAVVLVVGAGLLVRSFAGLTRVDPGLETDELLVSRISLPSTDYDAAAAEAFWPRLEAELDAVPGFTETALVRSLPLRNQPVMEVFLRAGETEESAHAAGHVPSFDYQLVTPGYFRTAGIPLVAGRDVTEADRADTPRVAVVSESLARRYFPDRDAIGEQIRILSSEPEEVPFEIIGIAADVRHAGLDQEPPIQIYVPYAQAVSHSPGLVGTAAIMVRTGLEAGVAAEAIRRSVRELDADLAVADVAPMSELVAESVARPRFTAVLLSLLSALALVLACVGVYSVVAYSVAQRTREMGIRLALGARPGEIVALVLREGLTPAAAGVIVGIVGALALTRLMSNLLFGVSSTDPTTYVLVVGALGTAALLAAWWPARRATRVDALEALRAE